METLAGWSEDINKGNLPINARKYVNKIEELTERPIKAVSVGVRRKHTIIRS
jgi:adenylosuccinate synthase